MEFLEIGETVMRAHNNIFLFIMSAQKPTYYIDGEHLTPEDVRAVVVLDM